MALFLLILLVVLAALGLLKLVIQVALGVALGITLAIALIAAVVGWRVRKLVRGTQRRWRDAQSRRPSSSSSHIEVLDRRDDASNY
jgi:membrane protein implicated in regulation of membrane protease activity